jgi:hypothetical protein
MEAMTFEDFALLMIAVSSVSMIIGGVINWIILTMR